MSIKKLGITQVSSMCPNLFMILHDCKNGVYGAENTKGHYGLIFTFLIFFALENLTEDLCLHHTTR